MIFYNIFYSSSDLFPTIFNLAIWIVLGAFYVIYLILKDLWYFIKILSYHKGCIHNFKADSVEKNMILDK